MKPNLTDLDYFRTKDDIIFLVKGYCHPENSVVAIPVFWGAPDGERLHISGRRYHKDVNDVSNEKLFRLLPHYRNPEIPKVAALAPLADIVEVFKPRQAFQRFLITTQPSIWSSIAFAFHEMAQIPLEDIGIFGSYLVGLAETQDGGLVKDVDFLIYGLDNFRRLRNGDFEKIRQALGFGRISLDHIVWHTEKYGRHFQPGLTNFPETLKHKWPSSQIAPGLLATVRFVYKENEVPENPIVSRPMKRIVVRGVVQEDERAHFMPRVFTVLSEDRIFTVITYFWSLYCAVQKGDKVEITGVLHEQGDLISLDNASSGIKIL